jgi:hypothetical protein
MGAVAIPMIVASTLISAYAQQQAAAARQAEMARNAQIAETFGRYAESEGAYKASVNMVRGATIASEAKARAAALGADVASGGVAGVVTTTRFNTEIENKRITDAAAFKKYGYQTQAQSFQREAEMAGQESWMRPMGTLLAGAGQAIGAGYAMGMIGNDVAPDLPMTIGNTPGPSVPSGYLGYGLYPGVT